MAKYIAYIQYSDIFTQFSDYGLRNLSQFPRTLPQKMASSCLRVAFRVVTFYSPSVETAASSAPTYNGVNKYSRMITLRDVGW